MGGKLKSLVGLAAASAIALAPVAVGGTTGGSSVGWVPTLPVSQQSWQMLSAFPNGTAYVFDRGSDAMTLWHSADHGLAWDALTYLPPGADTFLSIRFGTPTVGYAVDGETWLRTTVGATTPNSWQTVRRPAVPRKDLVFGHALGVDGHTVAVGGELDPPPHNGCTTPVSENIWTSHDEGRDWISATLPRHTDVASVDYIDDRLGVAVAYDLHDDPADSLGPCTQIGNSTSLYVTRDGGHHFKRVFNCARVTGETCWSAKFFTTSTLIAGRNDGSTVISHDGGRTFRPGTPLEASIGSTGTHQDDDFWVQGFDFVNQVGYATTKLGGAFRTTDLGRTWTRETSCDSAYSLGIGEIAAFDADRAVAGGPTCVATRVSAPAGAAAATPASTTGRPDIVERAGGRARTVRDGLELVVR